MAMRQVNLSSWQLDSAQSTLVPFSLRPCFGTGTKCGTWTLSQCGIKYALFLKTHYIPKRICQSVSGLQCAQTVAPQFFQVPVIFITGFCLLEPGSPEGSQVISKEFFPSHLCVGFPPDFLNQSITSVIGSKIQQNIHDTSRGDVKLP